MHAGLHFATSDLRLILYEHTVKLKKYKGSTEMDKKWNYGNTKKYTPYGKWLMMYLSHSLMHFHNSYEDRFVQVTDN